MSQPFLGEIKMFGGNFAPVGFAMANGQLVSIAQNNALYALYGTTYGGDGVNTFGLPNLQGRLPLNQGQGPGLTTRVIGELSGSNNVTLTVNQMPQHQHLAVVNNTDPTNDAPASNTMPCRPKQVVGGNSAQLYTDPTKTPVVGDLKVMAPGIIGNVGNSLPHDNMMPYLVITYIVALQGIFPSQN